MATKRKFVFFTFLLAALLQTGCEKKKASLPQKTQAPTVAVQLPNELPLTEIPQEPVATVSQSPPEPTSAAKAKPKKTAKNGSNAASAKKNPPSSEAKPKAPPSAEGQTVASLRPPKAPVVESPPASALAAAIPDAQLTQQKEDTARMVEATENQLKGMTRSLSDDEKSMRSQIQSYLQQSRKATTDGDFERAYNLAKKAQLLADALIKK